MAEGKVDQKFKALGVLLGVNLAIMLLYLVMLYIIGDWHTSEYSLIGYYFYLAVGGFAQFLVDFLVGIFLRKGGRRPIGNSLILSGVIVLFVCLPVGYAFLRMLGN